MGSLIEVLAQHLSKVQVLAEHEPQKEVGKNEVVIGILSEDLKKLYALMLETERDIRKHMNSISEEKVVLLPANKQKEFFKKGEELAAKGDLSKEMFLVSLRYHFIVNELCDGFESMGVRKNWQVIIKKISPQSAEIINISGLLN